MLLIKTVDQLTHLLDQTDPDKYSTIMKNIEITADQIKGCDSWTKRCYTRNCLARTDKYEVILLCWDKRAKAPIHGHGGEDCWVYQIEGTIEEIRYTMNDECLTESHRIQLKPGILTYMNDQMGYHSIENNTDQRAMTLHIYTSPIDKCKVYNDNNDCFEEQKLAYDTFLGVEAGQPVC